MFMFFVIWLIMTVGAIPLAAIVGAHALQNAALYPEDE